MNSYEFALRAAQGLFGLGRAISINAHHEKDPATAAAMIEFSNAVARLRQNECQKLINAAQAHECVKAEMHTAAEAVLITIN